MPRKPSSRSIVPRCPKPSQNRNYSATNAGPSLTPNARASACSKPLMAARFFSTRSDRWPQPRSAKVLTALDSGTIRRLGGTREIPSRCPAHHREQPPIAGTCARELVSGGSLSPAESPAVHAAATARTGQSIWCRSARQHLLVKIAGATPQLKNLTRSQPTEKPACLQRNMWPGNVQELRP